jgi:hypothetical protein
MTNEEKYYKYLTELEDWGVKDMSTSAPYLVQQFPELTLEDARKVLRDWSATKYQQLNESR